MSDHPRRAVRPPLHDGEPPARSACEPVTAPGLAERLAALGPLRLTLYVAIAAWALWPHLSRPHELGIWHDWSYFTQMAEATRRSLVDYGQLPQWNPWYCGGVPAVGNLQSNAGSPSALLFVLFGVGPGMRMLVLLYTVLAMEGTWRLARWWGASATAALFAGLFFGLSGRFIQAIDDGQPVFYAFALFPWVVWSFERGLLSWRYALIGGGWMAWLFLEGGAVPTPHTAVQLGILLIVRTAWRAPMSGAGGSAPAGDGERAPGRDPGVADGNQTPEMRGAPANEATEPGGGGGQGPDPADPRGAPPTIPTSPWPWWRPLAVLAAMAGTTAALTLFRLLPAAESVLRYPRQWSGRESFSAGAVLDMLATAGEAGYHGPGSAYISMAVVALACVAALGRGHGGRLALALALVSFWIATGHGRGPTPWELILELPVLSNVRNPFRYTFFIACYASVAAAFGLDTLRGWISATARRAGGARGAWTGWLATIAVVAVASVAVSSELAYARQRLDGFRWREAAMRLEQPFRQSTGNRWDAHVFAAANLGTLSCFEEQPLPTTRALRGDLVQEEYLLDPSVGTVMRVSWSPHRIVLATALRDDAIVLVNQNGNRGWRVTPGEIVEHEGLVAARVPAGTTEVVFRYRDPLVATGGAVSLMFVAGLTGLLVVRRRRRSRT